MRSPAELHCAGRLNATDGRTIHDRHRAEHSSVGTMPAPGPHPRSHDIGASIQIDAPERATHKHESSRLAFKGSAMDVLHRAEQEPEPISIARCRKLLGEE